MLVWDLGHAQKETDNPPFPEKRLLEYLCFQSSDGFVNVIAEKNSELK